MPQVVLGAAISAGLGAIVGGGAFATLFIQNLALGAISKALAPKPSSAAAQLQDNTQTIRSSVASRKIIYGRTRVGGTVVYLESTGADNKYLHMVVAMAGHEIDGYEKLYFGDQLVWDSATGLEADWSSHVRFNYYDGTQTTADADLVTESAHWTSSHVLNDTAYIYLRLQYNRDKFPDGIPNVSAVVRGKPVFDPRTSTTAWSSNPALCIRDYLLDTKYGMSADAAELNTTSFNAAANLCDETVTTSTGTQSRYLLDGVIDTANTRQSIIESMLSAMGGSLVYSGGEFYVSGAAYETPTVSLDESVIVDSIGVQTKRSRRELFNGVKGTFASSEDNYIVTDYPAIISSTYSTEDGEPVYLDLNLPYTTDVLMAERIAKLSLLRSRKQITCSVRCNLSAIALKAGDTVMLSNTRFGWTNKVFDITNLSFEADNEGRLFVALNLIETSADVYDWTTSDEINFVAGQPTTLPNPFTVIAPTNLVLTNATAIQEDGTARPAIDISWTNNDAFASMFEVLYSTNGVNFESALTSATTYRLEDVSVSSTYTIRVRAINRLGVRSDYDEDSSVATGDITAPSVPSTLVAGGAYRQIHLTWAQPSEDDLDLIYIYRHTANDSGAASKIAEVRGNRYIDAGLGMNETYYYWVKAVDRTGNESAFSTGTSATTTYVDDNSFEDGVRQLFIDQGVDGIASVSSLPASGDYYGQVVFLTTDGKLYRWVQGSPDAWTNAVDGADLEAGTVAGSSIVANTITGGLIAASGIITNSAQIDDSVITNAKIANAAITTAKIADLQVDTVKIADNAVTVPVGTIVYGPITYTTSYTTVASITVPGNNVPHILNFSGTLYNIDTPETNIRIVENGSVVWGPIFQYYYFSDQQQMNGAILFSGSTVSRTYNLQVSMYRSLPTNSQASDISMYSLTVRK